MKRGLVFTLCALAVTAAATVGQAQTVDLTLNLRYNDPNSPAAGGNWYLLGKTTGGGTNLGIAGVSAFLLDVDPVAFHGSGVPLAAGQSASSFHSYPAVGQATINNIFSGAAAPGTPFNGTFAGARNVVYGQDLSVAGILSGVGMGGPGNVASDPLRNSTYNNYSLLLSGTFSTATRPSFSAAAGQAAQANVLVSTTPGTAAVAATTVTTHVRGDSVTTLGLNTPADSGLRPGDANRDGIVNGFDFAILSGNFDPPNSTGTKTWDQGNFNSAAQNGRTDGFDFAILSGNFSPPNGPSPPPAIGAVPEPASAALLGMAFLGLAIRAKRR